MSTGDGRTWGQTQRFEFIEWRLFWEGRLNRRDIELQFGVSTPQASIDIRNYQLNAPGNILYDSTIKTYIKTTNFEARYLSVMPDRYLLQMQAISNDIIDISDTWFSHVPNMDAVPRITRTVPPGILSRSREAISNSLVLDVMYRSLTNTRRRKIAPHSFAFDGQRWHLRAKCLERGDYRDFLLTRIESCDVTDISHQSSQDDIEWNTFVDLVIEPHPELSTENRETIHSDYGMRYGQLTLKMRVALAYYFIRRNNLDAEAASLPPERLQISLKNAQQVEETMRSMRHRRAL